MRPNGTSQHLEKRRYKAIALLKAGKNLSTVANAVGSSVSSVFRWWESYHQHGHAGLKSKPTPGRPRKLSDAQKKKLLKTLAKGARKAGYKTELWTLARIAQVIDDNFGIQYHPSHVWKLLTSLEWSCQKPERRALQRDEKAIAHWKRYKWPRLKKSPRTWCPSDFP
jgi:transposase